MSRVWSRVPLRTLLPVLLAGLLAVGLVVSGAVALRLLERTMVDELDRGLEADAPRLVQRFTGGVPRSRQLDSGLPSDYVVVLLADDGTVVGSVTQGTADGVPDLPDLSVADVAERGGDPFTVPGSDGTDRWRVVARTLVSSDRQTLGSVAVALPMTGVEATTARMRGLLVAVGALALVAVSLTGWWAVRRALRPLTQIEGVAAAIAAGDLSRRVPEAPAGTEVGRLGRSLNEMLGQLERAFAARTASEERMRRFVADAGHELRTPLAAVRGYAELHRMGALADDEAVAATFTRVEESARRMGRLVEDLLHLARLDEGRRVRREPVDLAAAARDAVADLRALDPGREVGLAVPPDGAVVLGDEDRLRQVLANLVGNVARHTPSRTPAHVRVTADPDAAAVVVEVHDDGPGIPTQDAQRVFERFYRVDASRSRDSGGTGLGMAIVAAIVRAHGGTVAVVPVEVGTTVRVTLPAARAATMTGPVP